MNDREKLKFKGPVSKVTESGTSTREWAFEADGTLVSFAQRGPGGMEWKTGPNAGNPARPAREVRIDDAGGRTESEDISKVNDWSMEALNLVAFGTRGAATAGQSSPTMGGLSRRRF